jgi:hypothetical protein
LRRCRRCSSLSPIPAPPLSGIDDSCAVGYQPIRGSGNNLRARYAKHTAAQHDSPISSGGGTALYSNAFHAPIIRRHPRPGSNLTGHAESGLRVTGDAFPLGQFPLDTADHRARAGVVAHAAPLIGPPPQVATAHSFVTVTYRSQGVVAGRSSRPPKRCFGARPRTPVAGACAARGRISAVGGDPRGAA